MDQAPDFRNRIGDDGNAEILFEHRYRGKAAPGAAGNQQALGLRRLTPCLAAKLKGEAHAFIDYLLRPEVAAKNSNFISYANGNLASQKLIDKALLDDKTVFPDEATMASLYTITAHDQRTQRTLNRLWTKIKTGR